jgi:gluconokinase
MIILLMGVSGSGKTTIGQRLAKRLGWQFYDADDFHPISNIEKMHHGIPLTDGDRIPWLTALHDAIHIWVETHTNVVLACSALKASYRDNLYHPTDPIKLVYLKGSVELIHHRLSQRNNHYMPPTLLHSQFDTLEEPQDAIVVDIAQSPDAIAHQIQQQIQEQCC